MFSPNIFQYIHILTLLLNRFPVVGVPTASPVVRHIGSLTESDVRSAEQKSIDLSYDFSNDCYCAVLYFCDWIYWRRGLGRNRSFGAGKNGKSHFTLGVVGWLDWLVSQCGWFFGASSERVSVWRGIIDNWSFLFSDFFADVLYWCGWSEWNMMIRSTLMCVLTYQHGMFNLHFFFASPFKVALISDKNTVSSTSSCKVAPISDTNKKVTSLPRLAILPSMASYRGGSRISKPRPFTPLSRLDLTLHIITFRQSPHDGTRGSSFAPTDRSNRRPSKDRTTLYGDDSLCELSQIF